MRRFLSLVILALAPLVLSAQAPQPDPKDPQFQATVVEGGYNNPFKMVPAPRPPVAEGQRAGGAGGGARAGGAGARAGGGGGRGAAPAPATKEDFERSEMDILYVTDLVAKEYNT